MTKLYQSKRKPETMVEAIWKRPFENIPFFYISPKSKDDIMKLEPDNRNTFLFTNIHEAIFDYINRFGNDHKFGTYHVYMLSPGAHITHYIMKNTNPNEELSFSCQMLQPVLLNYVKPIHVDAIIEHGKELVDLTFSFGLSHERYEYSEVQQNVSRWRMEFMTANIDNIKRHINTKYDKTLNNITKQSCALAEVKFRKTMKRLVKGNK